MSDEKHVTLSDGAQMPTIGLGTWKIPNDSTAKVVKEAVGVGYRHFDCACDYGNETEVGHGLAEALSEGLCSRDDVWITSKLWNTFHEAQHARTACERTLKDLQLDELDLYLVHFPVALAFVDPEIRYPPGWFFEPDAKTPAMKPIPVPYAETWGAMEELVTAGLVKRIGVCNLPIGQLRDLLAYCSIRPVVHQVEHHPYLVQKRLMRFCRDENISMTGFSPFGAGSYIPLNMAAENENVLEDPVLTAIAKAHGKSPAQVALRWAVQHNTVVVPKTQQMDRLVENLTVFDFALSEEDMNQIDALDRHRRFNDPGEFCEAAFNTFFPIFD